jgi:hypothetical protein
MIISPNPLGAAPSISPRSGNPQCSVITAFLAWVLGGISPLLLAAANSGGDPASLPPVRVYILAGQSNAEGHNHVRQYRGGREPFPTAWQDQREVMFWPGVNSPAGSNLWTTLRVADSGRFGPEIGFGKEMSRFSPGEDGNIAIIKYASGGTGIARSQDYTDYIPSLANFDDKGRNWHPPTDGKPAGNLYTGLFTNVHLALDTLSQSGRRWELAGFLWMQGEHEAGISRKMADDYGRLLAEFIRSVRQDLKAPSLPVVIGEINSHTWAFGDIARREQREACRRVAGLSLVGTVDLPRISGDGAHFTADGMLTLGARFASAFQGSKKDWLLVTPATLASVSGTNATLVLGNGLVERTFRMAPNLAAVRMRHLATGADFLRAPRPEGILTVDGTAWEIGGLRGQPDHSYMDPGWVDRLTNSPHAFRYVGHRIGSPEARYPWQPKFTTSVTNAWPPKGIRLTLDFQAPQTAPAKIAGLTVQVHYELYDGLPVIAKWLSVSNAGAESVTVDQMAVETLAVAPDQRARLLLDCEQIYSGAARWSRDPEWPTFALINPGDARYIPHAQEYLLHYEYTPGPSAVVPAGGNFTSFRLHELLLENEDRERSGLAFRRMYRTLTPQIAENPIFMHLRNSDSASIRRAVDQCAAVGFEALILTFWSGFNMESEDPAYIARIKADFDYAHSKGIRIGGYILLATTASKGPKHDAIDPKTGKPDGSLCLGSAFTDAYFERIFRFIDQTGLDIIETDGPYHGYECSSTEHKYHRGLGDSRWVQWEKQVAFYRACLERGIYINSPEWYFHGGSHKAPMGYREENWSLPRDLQIVLGRQNIYDGTWHKTPSMGWMMLPLTEYHGGGAAARLEPLDQHLDAYEAHLAQNFGSGVIACYRGPRLFDTDRTKAVVMKWTAFYKKYRAILDSDIIHVRRPDGRDIDCMLHVNPSLDQRGLAMVYNPLDVPVQRTLTLPLYYTGLTGSCRIRQEENPSRVVRLDERAQAEVQVKIPARSRTWFVVEPD